MAINRDRSKPEKVDCILCCAEIERKANAPEADLDPSDSETQLLLNELQVQYTELYDYAPVGYFTLGRDGTIINVNFRGASLIGKERSCLAGQPFSGFVPLGARQSWSAFLDRVFANQGRVSCEIELTPADKPVLFAQIEAAVCGPGLECRLALIDITGRRIAEEELIKKRQQLEELNRTFEARIAEALETLRQEDQILVLQDRLNVMGEMVNNIAHQWRQPLNTLGLVIQQLPVFYGSAEFTREFVADRAADAMNIITHMSQTIDGFRDFFRSDKELTVFGLNQAIDQTIFLIGKNLQNHQISIVVKVDGEPVIKGYRNEYIQVLLNILMNARDALVEKKQGDGRIIIHAFTEGSCSVVTISDNAGGIDDFIINRLFEPYFTTKGPDKGTGIGLFMSKVVIEKNMGGRLSAFNDKSGAVFRIEVNNDSD